MNALMAATAVVAGLTHALEADHMAAVTAFVARRPHPLRAMGFGIRWGMGHSAALLAAGAVLISLGLEPREAVVRWLEVAVGGMLIGLGWWALPPGWRRLRPSGAGIETDLPGHGHAGRHAHSHDGTLWVGAAHGLAGTAGFLALVPAMLLASPWTAGGYLVLFSVGTVVAMGGYGLLAGLVFHRAGARARVVMRSLTAGATMAIGIGWIIGALG